MADCSRGQSQPENFRNPNSQHQGSESPQRPGSTHPHQATPRGYNNWDDSVGQVYEWPSGLHFAGVDTTRDGQSDTPTSSTFGSPPGPQTHVTNLQRLVITPVRPPISQEEMDADYLSYPEFTDSNLFNENYWGLKLQKILAAEKAGPLKGGEAHANIEAARQARSRSDDDDFSKLLAIVGQKRLDWTRDSNASTSRPARLSDINSTHFRQPLADTELISPILEHIRKGRMEEAEREPLKHNEPELLYPELDFSNSKTPKQGTSELVTPKSSTKSSPKSTRSTPSPRERSYTDPGPMPSREFLESAYDMLPELEEDARSVISYESSSFCSLYDDADLLFDYDSEEMSRGVVDLREVGKGETEMGNGETEMEAYKRWYGRSGR